MEGDIYHNGRFDDHLVDPSQELDLDLQYALLGDYNLPVGDFYFSNDEEFRLKSAFFDEDEGFNEECDDELHAATTGLLGSQEQNNRCSRDVYDAGVDLFDHVSTTMANPSGSGIASFMQAGSQDQCLPIDSCYSNSVWNNDAPMELISSRDHVMSPIMTRDHMMSPVKLHELPSETSPQNSHNKLSVIVSHDQPNSIPSNDELIDMPFYKFKRLLDNPLLSADDKVKVKAVRKKGKNKSAARHCRQRKTAMLEGLEEEVAILQQQHSLLIRQKEQLIAETKFWETRCATLQ